MLKSITACLAGIPLILGACSSSNGVDQGGADASTVGGVGASSNGGGATAAQGGNGQAQGGANANVGGNNTGAMSAGGTGAVSSAGGSGATGGSAVFLPCDATACTVANANCGSVIDSCGNAQDCGTCPTGSTCGVFTPNQCSTTCTPQTCPANANCGYLSDGCGGILDCSGGNTCASGELCIANICTSANGNGGDASACSGFCTQQSQSCPTTTTVSGTVLAPNGSLPIPNAVVYVPNGSTKSPYGVTPFVDGVANNGCACDISGNPLVSAVSGVDGSFTLSNVPVGSNIPLVIQLGRWRRMVTIPTVTECQNTAIDASLTSLPSVQNMGNNGNIDAIPLMAISTGEIDAIECVFRKIGIADSQFANGEQTNNAGRIRLYRQTGAPGGPGASCTNGGGSCTGPTPSYTTLVANQASVDRYDALIFPCKGGAHDESAQAKTLILDSASNMNAYVNKGGRAFFTHFSYAWLYNQPPSINLPWRSTTNSAANEPNGSEHNPAEYVQVDTTFARGQIFAQWLGLAQVGALSVITPPQISVVESRSNMIYNAQWTPWDNSGWAQRWLYYTNDTPDPAPMHVTFDTPVGVPASQQCGRVLYSDFHVTSFAMGQVSCATNIGGLYTDQNCTFPNECNSTFSAQEKTLAYFIFDMTSCVQPPSLSCTPKTCADYPTGTCGPQSDNCGGIVQCPPCQGCTPKTCEQDCPNGDCSSTNDGTTYVVDCPQSTGCQNPLTISCWCKVG